MNALVLFPLMRIPDAIFHCYFLIPQLFLRSAQVRFQESSKTTTVIHMGELKDEV